ncbi:family 43 glycosylhydrolase [Paenibacillus sp. BC26]|uniref:family 43 glycosylhydrolase n=1 Tax=Paenibacillus sp. BC26 TaxID=1881032 RepID=UPI00210A38E4|nr:family 43 glycosylhydrolase [Paenibacillus sp. BC26]
MQLSFGQTYTNALQLEDEWPDYGIGDPYVMRYNGKYYLYCSTKDFRVGIKAWSSDNLVNWRYEGLVTEDPISEGAYAPEVVYWNGYFYMYTSPAGKGHYVFRSDSPTGPFTKETDNFGLTIDGSVFIDDDAKWYFTRAEFGGITGHEMASPLEVELGGTKLNTSLGHWTEGSMIIKRNGRYFMTYTGNHVFSKGYRINYAVAKDSPLGSYTIPENNPIVISTDNAFNGLGHSSSVLGPDLDSYYMFYHNLIGHSAEGPPVRMLNMDRLVFNGDKMAVLGPTHYNNLVPKLPDFQDTLDRQSPSPDKWEQPITLGKDLLLLSKAEAGGRFTAEFNFSLQQNADAAEKQSFAAVFSYSEAQGAFRAVRVVGPEHELNLEEYSGETSRSIKRIPLPEGTDLRKLHTIRIQSDEEGTEVYWDGLLLIDENSLEARPGKIGYLYDGGRSTSRLMFTAFSNAASGSSDFEAFKTLPGSFEAVHYLEGEDRGFHLDSKAKDKADFRIADGVLNRITDDGSYAVTLQEQGDWLQYAANVGSDGTYLFAVTASLAAKSGAEFELSVDDDSRRFTLDSDDFADGTQWSKVPIGYFQLTPGAHVIRMKLIRGELTFRNVEASLVIESIEEVSDLLNRSEIEDIYGEWAQESDGSFASQVEDRDSKWFAGSSKWTDYRVGFDIMQTKGDTLSEGAMLLRVTNESDFPEQVRDAFMGYELAFRNDRVLLRKVNYECNEEVASASLPLERDQYTNLSVEVKGAHIRVFAGEVTDSPLIEWQDSNAFLHGRIGLRSASPDWRFAHVMVTRLPDKE